MRQDSGLQDVVERFYPADRLNAAAPADPAPGGRGNLANAPLGGAAPLSTYAVLNTAADGAPDRLLAVYTARNNGVVRVLARTAAAWDVADESAASLLLPGGQAIIRLPDLDFDGRPEAMVMFAAARASTTWIFKWDGSKLLNWTPTQRAANRDGDTSILLSASAYDLDHAGPMQIVAERMVERPGPGQRPRFPGYVYKLGASGYELEKTIVAIAGFRGDVAPESNVRPFRLIQDSEPPYRLRVINGERGARNRVEGASVFINNRWAFDRLLVNQNTGITSIPFDALITENRMTATLMGSPDSRLLVLVEDSTKRT